MDGAARQGYYQWRSEGPGERKCTDAELTEQILENPHRVGQASRRAPSLGRAPVRARTSTYDDVVTFRRRRNTAIPNLIIPTVQRPAATADQTTNVRYVSA